MEEKRSWWQKIIRICGQTYNLLLLTEANAMLFIWTQIRIKRLLLIVGIIVVGVLMTALIVAITSGYLNQNWDWTGFKEGTIKITITSTPKGNYTAIVPQPYKTLWDWLGLLAILAIPVVVGIGAAWFTAQQGKVSDRENIDNQRETALQKYIDSMSELLLKYDLSRLTPDGKLKSENEEVRKIARVRTLSVLLRLDAERKGNVLEFLQESGLIERDLTILNLNGANLRGVDGNGIILKETNLILADLSGADLYRALLYRADLRGADLRGAKLSEADLSGNLPWGEPTEFSEKAQTGETLLQGYGANLRGAKGTTPEQLNDVFANIAGDNSPFTRYHKTMPVTNKLLQ